MDEGIAIRRWIGIDPGLHGGIAIVSANPGWAKCWPMPQTEREVLALLHALTLDATPCAVIEKLGPRPPMMCSCKTNWILSGSYHAIRMALTASGIPYDEALPKDWQAAVGCPAKKGRKYAERKKLLRQRAQSMFPDVDVTNETADALLLAVYARRLYSGSES